MLPEKKEHPQLKNKLHPRNRHRERYDFKALIETCPDLTPFVTKNDYQDLSIDFFNPQAVIMLNKALLKHFYHIDNWSIPPQYLCPPVPGRADYIHHIADLLATCNNGNIPTGDNIKCLDIGVGASCIYPIIGHHEYGWSFVGSETDPVSIESANKIIESNPQLKKNVKLQFQKSFQDTFNSIIKKGEVYDVSICNPPYHTSLAEAQAGNLRKINHLKKGTNDKPLLNFGGQNRELWCEGGEEKFVRDMIRQSKTYAPFCFWFTTLISKEYHLKEVYDQLKKAEVTEVKTIKMGQGNKISRIVAWTFFSPEQKSVWTKSKN